MAYDTEIAFAEAFRRQMGTSAGEYRKAVNGHRRVWADGLKPLLTQRLGPPAGTHQAPPPTGDPSLIVRPIGRAAGG